MLLKRLELVGFKSFATRTVVDVVPGVIGVVGPNGSGKSNVADGVRWVLGEQSARAVRARKPEEVIFAGSATRQPLGMAEVSLLLENDGQLPVDFDEIQVSRRLYRSGDSEYLLNGSKVRLRDITQLLLHAGLGADTYAVIGQGAVDELILQRPEERRIALENAADVRRHQIQLAETRSRLAGTESNLARVRDVLAEMGPHVRRLKTQADRAARAEEMRRELRGLQVRFFRSRLVDAQREGDVAQEALERATRALQQSQDHASQTAASLAEQSRLLAAGEARARAARADVDEVRQRVRVLEQQHAVGQERLAQLAEQGVQADRDIAGLVERRTSLENERAQAERDVCAAETSVDTAADQQARQRAAAVATDLGLARQAARETRQARSAADEQWRAAETYLARLEERLRTLESGTARSEEAEEQRSRHVEQARATLDGARQALAGAQEVAQSHQTATAERQAARARFATHVEEARSAAHAARREVDRLQGRLEGIGAVRHARPADTGAAWLALLDGLRVLGVVESVSRRVPPVARLAHGYLTQLVAVEDVETARVAYQRLSASLAPDATAWGVISLDGTLLTSGGEKRVALSREEVQAATDWRAQVEDLEGARRLAVVAQEEAEQAFQARASALAEEDRLLADAKTAFEQADAGVRQARTDERQARENLAQLEVEQAELRRRRQAEADERARLSNSAVDAQRQREEAREASRILMEAERTADDAVASLEEQSHVAQAIVRRLDDQRAEQQAVLLARRRLLDRTAEELARVALAHSAAEQRQTRLRARQVETVSQTREAATALTYERAVLSSAETTLREQEDVVLGLAAARQPAEQAAAAARNQERTDQYAHEDALLRAQRARDARESLEREVESAAESDARGESWLQQLRLGLADGVPDPAAERQEDLDALGRRMGTLQRDLRAVGDVGDAVVDDYQQMRERSAFLEQQSEDLVRAMADLRSAAGELEGQLSERFQTVFGAVDAAFQDCFRVLFGGGEARLVLTQPDDLLQTGVDIVARPPGKKLQGLLSLSGGERALTVVALLFGLLRVHPTPFVVLDEVDAALDEANVQRFAKLLKDLAGSIQFVVVTHNRATMEIADALYGVSMDTEGVSRILSVKPRDVAVQAGSGVGARERVAW